MANDDLVEYVLGLDDRDPRIKEAFDDVTSKVNFLKYCVQLREEQGISQQAVAEYMRTTQSAVSDIETGRSEPMLSTMQRYLRAIGCRLDLVVVPSLPKNTYEG